MKVWGFFLGFLGFLGFFGFFGFFFVSCLESANAAEKQLGAISKCFHVIFPVSPAAPEVWPVLPGESCSCSGAARLKVNRCRKML